MTFSFTGIVYFFGFVTISLLVNRFYQYWQREKSAVSKNFFIFLLIFDWFFFIVAIGGLFFAENPFALKQVVALSAFLQALAGAVFGHLLFYLKFPRISPWIGFAGIFILFGLPAVILTIITPFSPMLENQSSINWNIPSIVGILRYGVFLAAMLPYAFFCLNLAKHSVGLARKRAVSLGILLLLAIFIAPLDFFLNQALNFGALGSDFAIGIISLAFLIVVIIIQKPDDPIYVKKI